MAGKKHRNQARAAQYQHPVYRNAQRAMSARLRELREDRGWTMEEAADRCAMVYATYWPIESGRVNVTLTTLARLADGFGVNVWNLWVSEDDAKRSVTTSVATPPAPRAKARRRPVRK